MSDGAFCCPMCGAGMKWLADQPVADLALRPRFALVALGLNDDGRWGLKSTGWVPVYVLGCTACGNAQLFSANVAGRLGSTGGMSG